MIILNTFRYVLGAHVMTVVVTCLAADTLAIDTNHVGSALKIWYTTPWVDTPYSNIHNKQFGGTLIEIYELYSAIYVFPLGEFGLFELGALELVYFG